jgi:nucleoside-diphosphate-sugar epimerase
MLNNINNNNWIVNSNDILLVTGANGFIGTYVVATLLHYGFQNIRCFVRPSSNLDNLVGVIKSINFGKIQIIKGNLLSREDCNHATEGVSVIFHLAAGIEKSFPGSFMNSVVTTRNLIEATLPERKLKRFVNVSSLAVYSNERIKRNGLLDENSEVEKDLLSRHEPYVYAKVKQDELVMEYSRRHKIPYVIVRPGAVYGPGKKTITGRVGIDTFGIFLHLGGSNKIPLTYIDNCAEAIVLAGLKRGTDGEVFNIVDDQPPTSRQFLRIYKKNVNKLKSIYIPYRLFYLFSFLWEKYADWSRGQLPPAFNRKRCVAYWKGNRYSNKKMKILLGWKQKVSFEEAVQRYCKYCRANGGTHA